MINVGFIGAGDISLLHYEAIQNCNDANLRGIWTRTKENNISKSKLYNCLSYDSAEDLINDNSIDCIFILDFCNNEDKLLLGKSFDKFQQ